MYYIQYFFNMAYMNEYIADLYIFYTSLCYNRIVNKLNILN
jgi:hypothetical protein